MFFTQINQMMNQSVDITMVIRKSATGMTVSVLPKSNGLKDEAQNRIVPLTEKEKREKYEKHMKKAEELIAAKKHKDAIATLGQAKLYATEQNKKTVEEKIEEQKKAMSQGSLFDLMDEAAPQQLMT